MFVTSNVLVGFEAFFPVKSEKMPEESIGVAKISAQFL